MALVQVGLLLYQRFLKRLICSHLIFFFTIAIPAADAPPTVKTVCVEPAPLVTRVILALPYAIGALLYYVFGFAAQIISLALCLVALALYIPAFFLDLLLLRWATGEWVLTNAVSSLLKLLDFMDAYWRFGSEIHTKLWGNC